MNSSVLDRVGNTPLIEIRRLNPHAGVKILAKLESCNPGGSIKDRVAVAMIRAAEDSGELVAGKTVIEATSGNTGIGLAMACAVRGYTLKLLMSESASEERRMILRAYGAQIELTPGHLGTDGAIELAYRLAREEPDTYVLMDQYNNPACIAAHYNGTAKEIWEQTKGAVTHVVATVGTTGTAMGCAQFLHEVGGVFVAAVEPYAGHKIQGLKNMHESYPPGIYDKSSLDAVLRVEDEEAFSLCRALAQEEGLFVGMSSGAALAGALKLAETMEEGTIVVIFPDGGERYLSTPLFASPANQGIQLETVCGAVGLDCSHGCGLYTMGPNLDAPDDLEAWRRVVFLDSLMRYLQGRGIRTFGACGVADMDDRTLAAARLEGQSRGDFVHAAQEHIVERAKALGVAKAMKWPQASTGQEKALQLCGTLLSKGLAYEKLRSVYFDVFRDERYGQLSKHNMADVTGGHTVDLDAYVKDNPLDFTLLKRAALLDLKEGEVLDTQWGNVRPTWFLQHAAAALERLDRIDLVLGGATHRFPHLENLRALWSVAGREVQGWLVAERVHSDDGRTLEQVLEHMPNPYAVRLWLLSASYHKPLCASEDNLSMWKRNWLRLQDCAALLSLALDTQGDSVSEAIKQGVFNLKSAFTQAMETDIALHHFWPALFQFIKNVNTWQHDGLLNGKSAQYCLDQLFLIDDALGIIDREGLPVALSRLPTPVQELVAQRQEARAASQYTKADHLRSQLREQGFRVVDGSFAPQVFRCIEE